jgi:hypothetical protein
MFRFLFIEFVGIRDMFSLACMCVLLMSACEGQGENVKENVKTKLKIWTFF